MESKAGSVLLMISGIITILLALGLIIFSILILTGVINGEGSAAFGGGILLALGIFILILSFFKFWASGLMKNPETTKKGGIIALVVGIISSMDLLSIIGGILGIVQSEK